jgi:endoglucanase
VVEDRGSNSAVLNSLQVVGTAYDLTERRRYADGVLRGMDYVLGRNALNISYVTGYGTYASQNQHSRMYAHQVDPRLPNPPRGTLAGGPNGTALTTGDPSPRPS